MLNSFAKAQQLEIDDYVLDSVQGYVYLEQLLTAEPTREKKIPRRLGGSGYGRLSQIMTGSLLSLKRKSVQPLHSPGITNIWSRNMEDIKESEVEIENHTTCYGKKNDRCDLKRLKASGIDRGADRSN